jgi:integrase
MSKPKKARHRRGDGTIFTAGSDTKWIRYYVNGHSITENTNTTDERVAADILRSRVVAAKQGQVPEPSAIRKMTVANLYEALEREYRTEKCRSLDDLKTRWKLHLEPFFGFMRPVNVSTDLVNRYIDKRQQEGARDATINRELALLKRAFHLGRECTPPKVHNVPYIKMLKENNTRKGFLEPTQYDKLARECAKYGLWLRTLFELAYTYGWRHGELLSVKVEQVSIADRTIRLNRDETKNGEGREVTMTPLLRQLLQECIRDKKPGDSVLTRKNGKAVGDFRGSWENATTKAGVPGLLFHDLRRTAVRNMIRAGVPERVAMEISGHKTRSVFERYNIVSQVDIENAVTKLISQRTVRVEPELTGENACQEPATIRPN